LRKIVEQGNQDIEEMRALLAMYSKEKENEILVANSNIAQHQKTADAVHHHNSKVEQELMFRDNAYNDRKRALGECMVRRLGRACRYGADVCMPACVPHTAPT